MNHGPVEVDLAFTAVLDRGRESRLVLRRRVSTHTDDGQEVSVTELWTSSPCPSPFDVAGLVGDLMRSCGRELVRGQVVGALPGLAHPTTAQLGDLHQATVNGTVDVEHLAGYRGTVEDLWHGRPVLRDGEVVATGGFLGVAGRRLLVDVLRGLAVPQCSAPPSAAAADTALDPRAVRAALLRDLADARLRLDQERGWALLADTQLHFGIGAPLAPGWSRAVRRGLDGAVVEPDDPPDPARAAVVVVFVGGGGGRVDLFRYGVDPRLDLPGVLGDAAVRQAFAVCAARPGDSVAQTRAVAALRAVGPELGDRAAACASIVPATATLVPTKEPLDGVVVLHDCRAVTAGNDDRRFTTFAYVFAPARTTGELLRFRPDIVVAIVDHSCRIDDAVGGLRNALAAAVCADVTAP